MAIYRVQARDRQLMILTKQWLADRLARTLGSSHPRFVSRPASQFPTR